MIAQAADLSTPLTKKIASFSKILLIAILALAALTFAVGLWRGEGAVDMFMAAVALAVGRHSRRTACRRDHYAGHRREPHGQDAKPSSGSFPPWKPWAAPRSSARTKPAPSRKTR